MWLFITFAAGIAGLNAYAVVRGLATGEVATLHKSSGAILHRTSEPGAFAAVVALRALLMLIFGGWAAMLVRDEVRTKN